MNAKDLRTESALSERNNDSSKYSQSGGIALHCDRNKTYQDIGSNSLAKVDVQSARPCAVIGPDRVVPPTAPNEAYLKKGPVEPWLCMDNAYHTRRPPEYPHKLASFQNPTRNISPRQTFQENMQRIMVPPTYNSVKLSDDTNYVQISDRGNALPKNIKLNVPPEAKFCDVPYTVYPTSSEPKNVRNAEMCMPGVNPTLTRTAPHGWPSGSVNIRPTRAYGAPELYQYQEYPSCTGSRPVVPRPNRTVAEDQGYVYAEPFYHQEGNIRFKPYPTVKERFHQQRYEYIGNYANSFQPPSAFPTHKYELQKPVPPHHYSPYPPIKYLDRVPEPVMAGYQRNQQGNYMPYRSQIIHPNYGPILGNCPQNKIHSYPPDAHIKSLASNKLPYDNAKAYIEYENGRPKMYPPSESYLVNEMGRVHPMKSQVIMPNYPMQNIPPNSYYKKDGQQIKNYEYLQTHFRSMDPSVNIHNPMIRHPPVFSPNTLAISPTDSSTSNDTSQTLGNSQEDCGYVSQSSTTSARSIESGLNRISNDYFRKYYDSRLGPVMRTVPMMSKSESNSNYHSKEKKNIDVRQFLQMWNEGDEESEENSSKEIIVQAGPKHNNSQPSQEQLYVLGLEEVPSEELAKYEHIQKVSKLPENIKGYNHIELLKQFEEAIESSNTSNYKTFSPKTFQTTSKFMPPKQTAGAMPPRPPSPLDVEAKISQSVIHKEVGCNFEIKPCSPKMMNVEVATPVQNLLAERAIEKVANPVMLKSPRLSSIDENMDCNILKRKEHRMNKNNEPVRIPSCKMVNTQFSNNNNMDSIKNSYSLQDLESNSGLCLSSLPRLDNDIELNFPEVNQQFINANKQDSSIATPLRDLPSLDLLDQSDGPCKEKLNDINNLTLVNEVLKSPGIIDTDKEFSKLSKYRKTKTHSSDSKENQTHHVINAARTDSVIIKNPENVRNYEEKNNSSPNSVNKQISEIQEIPINLTSHGNVIEHANKIPGIKPQDTIGKNNRPGELAIDFSLNKSYSNENINEAEIVSLDTIDKKHVIQDDHVSIPTFAECDKDIQHNFGTPNKKCGNATEYNVSATGLQHSNNNDNLSLIKNAPLEEIFINNDCILPVSSIKEVADVNDSILSVVNVNDINDVSTNSILPIEFVTPTTEILQTPNVSNSSFIDIDKHCNIEDTNLHKPINNFIDNYQEDSDLNILNDMDNEEVKCSNGACPDVAYTPKINFELDIDTSKDNLKELTSATGAQQNITSNSFDVDKQDMLDNTTDQSDNMERTDTYVDLITPNNVDDSSTELHLSSINNVIIHNAIGPQYRDIEQDSNFNSLSPQNIVASCPNDSQSEIVKQKSDINSSLSSLNNDSTEDYETDTEFNLRCENSVVQHSPNYYQSTEEGTLNSSSKNILTQISGEKEDTKISCHSTDHNTNLFSPSNKMEHERIEDVSNRGHETTMLADVSECRISLIETEETHCEDILLNNNEDKCETYDPLKLQVKKGGNRNLGIRYLSYGSKEMYSPWIQKLVLFCEGNTNSVVTDEEKGKTICVLMETEAGKIDNTCVFDVFLEVNDNNIPNPKFNFENNGSAQEIENNTRNNLNLAQIKKEYSSNAINNYCKNELKAMENIDNSSESDTFNNTNTLQEQDNFKPEKSTHIRTEVNSFINTTLQEKDILKSEDSAHMHIEADTFNNTNTRQKTYILESKECAGIHTKADKFKNTNKLQEKNILESEESGHIHNKADTFNNTNTLQEKNILESEESAGIYTKADTFNNTNTLQENNILESEESGHIHTKSDTFNNTNTRQEKYILESEERAGIYTKADTFNNTNTLQKTKKLESEERGHIHTKADTFNNTNTLQEKNILESEESGHIHTKSDTFNNTNTRQEKDILESEESAGIHTKANTFNNTNILQENNILESEETGHIHTKADKFKNTNKLQEKNILESEKSGHIHTKADTFNNTNTLQEKDILKLEESAHIHAEADRFNNSNTPQANDILKSEDSAHMHTEADTFINSNTPQENDILKSQESAYIHTESDTFNFTNTRQEKDILVSAESANGHTTADTFNNTNTRQEKDILKSEESMHIYTKADTFNNTDSLHENYILKSEESSHIYAESDTINNTLQENDNFRSEERTHIHTEANTFNNTNTLPAKDILKPEECTHIRTKAIEHKNSEKSTESFLVNYDENCLYELNTLSNDKDVTCCSSLDVHKRSDSPYNYNKSVDEDWHKQHSHNGLKPDKRSKESNYGNDIAKPIDKQSNWNDDVCAQDVVFKQCEKESNCNVQISEQSDKQSNLLSDVPVQCNEKSKCSDDVLAECDEETKGEVLENRDRQSNINDDLHDQCDKESSGNNEIFESSASKAKCNDVEVKSSNTVENDELSCTKLQTSEHIFLNKQRQPLKRSLSDSALNICNNNNNNAYSQRDNEENVQFIWPMKRRKIQNNIIAQNLCNIIQHNRRNSISAFCNEEHVSFCILIDNDCIITEEETDEQEKICYTELPEECMTQIQNDCTEHEENLEAIAEIISTPQHENDCEYSDSYIMQNVDDKYEESWVDDVACVETVISDDIAADIEISESLYPKDDVLSDNDESGVFSNSGHTEKVKYIYGDKMCNDDAQFVETLYNTPQMDVNKTLVQRETLISGEYYDTDSLHKVLSDSNDQDLPPYESEHTGSVFSPGIENVIESVENKENMDVVIIPPLQNQVAPSDVVDTAIDKIHNENVKLAELFEETQDDTTVHSCESSVDNVFTYKENNGNTNYTSSSPEVSSTTSEEKNSAILLKITSYKGSRISHINDNNRDSLRPSCKFTEDKDYVQSQSNFSRHRPLLTKAAQKYIPPLKESIRDLKVKLSLPQHSLIKLKQLKISKDKPKVDKQNKTVPSISKKPKPKFEDVLKSIDEIHIKMHKEKTKKSKKAIPKVVIKKNEYGSHYASTSNSHEYNPDLTGRKWQPWVFIEKNHFIDKMAIRKKSNAIYSHRRRTYVLAEKFQKYKSVNSANFVISPPVSDCPSTGLKYTIRLKHNY